MGEKAWPKVEDRAVKPTVHAVLRIEQAEAASFCETASLLLSAFQFGLSFRLHQSQEQNLLGLNGKCAAC